MTRLPEIVSLDFTNRRVPHGGKHRLFDLVYRNWPKLLFVQACTLIYTQMTPRAWGVFPMSQTRAGCTLALGKPVMSPSPWGIAGDRSSRAIRQRIGRGMLIPGRFSAGKR